MPLDYEKKGRIAYFTFNAPERLNAYDTQMLIDLGKSLRDFMEDPQVLVGILTGAGTEAFSAGANLKRYVPDEGIEQRFSYESQVEMYWHGKTDPLTNDYGIQQVIRELDSLNKPIVGAVHGYCLGGSFTLFLQLSDIRVAADTAKFGFAQAKRGMGGSAPARSRILHQIPYAIAMELVLLGRMMDAQEALRVGLINKVVPPSELMNAAEDYANQLCQIAPFSLRAAKEFALREWRGQIPWELVHRYAQGQNAMVYGSKDQVEAVKSFLEKRPPEYSESGE